MLTVYSTQGSPGASTTAMHLAANWASEGREVLLIEADPAGGSLSHNLGIQFTPGSASFVASGLPILSNHLIDHAQDVLFENLHVMPAPASPTGARGIFNTFAAFSEDLRTISESEMAVIIDGGRMTADTAASALTTGATGVVVVCRNNSQLPSLEHLRDALAASPGSDGPQACAVTVGKSPMDPKEWQETYGLTFCGSIEIVADMATDLSAYLARSKRKSKKWRASLEQVGEKLYPYAQPPVSNRPRRPAAAAPPDTEVSSDAGQGTPAAAPPDTEVSSDAGQGTPAAAPPDTEVSSDAGQGTPAAAPPDTEVSSDAGQANPRRGSARHGSQQRCRPGDPRRGSARHGSQQRCRPGDPRGGRPSGRRRRRASRPVTGRRRRRASRPTGRRRRRASRPTGRRRRRASRPQPGHGQSHYLPPTPNRRRAKGSRTTCRLQGGLPTPRTPAGRATARHRRRVSRPTASRRNRSTRRRSTRHNPTNNRRSTVTTLRTTAAVPVTTLRTTAAVPVTTLRTTAAVPVTTLRTTAAVPVTTLRTTAAVPVTTLRTTAAVPVTTLRTAAAVPVATQTLRTATAWGPRTAAAVPVTTLRTATAWGPRTRTAAAVPVALLRAAGRPARAAGPGGRPPTAAGDRVPAEAEHAAHRLVPGLGRQAARLERRGHDSSPRRVRALSAAVLWQ